MKIDCGIKRNCIEIFPLSLIANCFGRTWQLLCQVGQTLYCLIFKVIKFICCHNQKQKEILTTSTEQVLMQESSHRSSSSSEEESYYSLYQDLKAEDFQRYLIFISIFEACDEEVSQDLKFFENDNLQNLKSIYKPILPLFKQAVIKHDPKKYGPVNLKMMESIVWEAFCQFKCQPSLHGKFELFDHYLKVEDKKDLISKSFYKNRPYFTFLLIEAYFSLT